MPQPHDVIIVGLGAMGSAAAYHLSGRHARVLGIDRFAPPHDRGSSHGKSRIIREAYFEHPLYVPIVQRAYECWRELEQVSGRHVLRQTGGLMLGQSDGSVVAGALASARQHGLPHEELTASDVSRRVPAFCLPPEQCGVWEPRAGMLEPEAAIAAHLSVAQARGAELRLNEPVLSWSAFSDGVAVTTTEGTYTARHLILSAGAWISQLLPELTRPLVVERNVLYWFRPRRNPERFGPDAFPIFIAEYDPGHFWYGFPDVGDGLKVALHHDGEHTTADTVRRDVDADEIAAVRSLLQRFLPDANGDLLETAVCLYTNAPDDHFIIDRHPDHPAVVIASPCSGHGFKFSSTIGEILADLVTAGRSRFDLSPFAITRFR
jgi:sarcosine oxidase